MKGIGAFQYYMDKMGPYRWMPWTFTSGGISSSFAIGSTGNRFRTVATPLSGHKLRNCPT
jgi:hypothetical protein